MYFDALTALAVCDEFRALLRGGRVQNIIQANAHSIGFEIYAARTRHYLLMSADPRAPRAHLVTGKFRRGVMQPIPLMLRLRSYISGARLVAVRVPDWERVLYLDFEGPEGAFRIIVEAIERRGNILLLDGDGMILECIRRVGPQENRVRLSLPGHAYVPPPPQIKCNPTDLTLTRVETWLLGAPNGSAWRVLVSKLRGVSPLLARELVYRAAQDIDTPAHAIAPDDLYEVIESSFLPVWEHAWEPCVVEDADGVVKAFAPYPLTHLDGMRSVDSISAAAEMFFGAPVGVDAYIAAKKPVAQDIKAARKRLSRKLRALQRSQRDPAEIQRLRQSGELILAYQYSMTAGQESFRAAYEVDGPELTIKLDPVLSPVENAQRYFRRYEKAKSANKGVPELIQETERALAFLDQLALDLELAENWPEIEEVRSILEAQGYVRGPARKRPQSGKSKPLRVVTDDGFVIWVGRNARQNDDVTFVRGSADDLWLHARGVPGAHVIIKNDGRDIPDAVIEHAARLAARYSPKRGEARVLVDVTQRKHVRKIKGGKPGMVTYRNEEPITVRPLADPPG